MKIEQGQPFTGRARRTPPTEIVVHESCTPSVASTVRGLARKGLGVHYIIGPDGAVTQHAPHNVILAHAGAHNPPSLALEVINPYYPDRAVSPWGEVLDARWAHRNTYLLPTHAQLEATASLVAHLLEAEPTIPRVWCGYSPGRMWMHRVEGLDVPRPGIHAHTYWAHSDGAFPVLYAWLRLEGGRSAEAALEEACRIAATQRKFVEVAAAPVNIDRAQLATLG